MEKRLSYRKILKITIPLTLIFIWGNSIMPGKISGNISGGFLSPLKKLLGITSTEANNTLHLVIRKIGHLSEFGILGLQITMYNYKDIKKKLSPIILCGLLVALADETIQLFIDGRAGEVADVWIDLTGYLVGISVVSMVKNAKSKPIK